MKEGNEAWEAMASPEDDDPGPKAVWTDYADYMRERRANKRLRGECIDCKKPSLPGRTACDKHSRRRVERNRKARLKKQKERQDVC